VSLFGRGKEERGDDPPSPTAAKRLAESPTVAVPKISDAAPAKPRNAAPPRSAASTGGHDVTHVGRSVVLKGDLSGEEDLTIEGEVKGRIDLPDHELTIGASGRIEAELAAKAVVVVGTVTGNIRATERVEIHDSGSVTGDIQAPRLLIHEGAVINGSVDMSDPADRPKAAATPADESKEAS
jgi:cytoskeletal protein CcmA (bactofilin family)